MGDGTYILLIEDSLALAETYKEYLRPLKKEVRHFATGAEALAQVSEELPSLVILDLKLPDMNGLEILKKFGADGHASRVVVITAHGSVSNAVDAMRLGASDFLVKPFDAKRLQATLRNALDRQRLLREARPSEGAFARDRFGPFIGQSRAMQSVYRMIEGAAGSKASVFIVGESGTGKELCAETIHRLSDRRDEPFVPLNCAAIPKELMESEIFGHRKGAFTGALEHRDGAALRADGGTLFLDEISEMDLSLQSKLLRFIQTCTVQKVGDDTLREVDIRFMCATNRTPLEEIDAGRFRGDLYYRLHVIPIHMPPLRDRREDIVLTARLFLRRFSRDEGKSFSDFSEDAVRLLLAYDWPGNVRELENVIQSAVVLSEGDLVDVAMLENSLGHPGPVPAPGQEDSVASISAPQTSGVKLGEIQPQIQPLWQAERDVIERAIEICGGNIPQAAARLEVSPSTIYRKLQAWNEREAGQGD